MVILGGLELVAAGILFHDYNKEKQKTHTKQSLQDWEKRKQRYERRNSPHRKNSSSRPSHPLQQQSLYPPQQRYPPRASSAPPPNAGLYPPPNNAWQGQPQRQWQPQPQPGQPMWQHQQPHTIPPPQPQAGYHPPQPQWQAQAQPPQFAGYPPQNRHPSFNRDPDAKNANLYYPSQQGQQPPSHQPPGQPHSSPSIPGPHPGAVELPAEMGHPIARPDSGYNSHLAGLRWNGPPSVISSTGSEAMGERPNAPPPAYTVYQPR